MISSQCVRYIIYCIFTTHQIFITGEILRKRKIREIIIHMNNNLIQFGFYNNAFTLRFHIFHFISEPHSLHTETNHGHNKL